MIQAEVDKSHIAALGRSILRTSASFLRIVCNHAIEGQDPFGGALCIDLNIIAQVFVRISGLLPPSVTSSPSNYSSSSAPDYQWLATSQALVSFAPQASMEPMLIEEFEEICCHLVCIIHDIVLLSTDEERESNCRQTLSKMLAAAEKWTPHSFVRTVASKIADLLV